MSLHNTQHIFWRSVRFDPAPPEVEEVFLDHGQLSGRERMAIYRDMYWGRQVTALRASFEHLEAVLGQEEFTKLAVRFIRRHPSQHGALERLGMSMAAFLADEGHPAWLVDLGRLEWLRLEALLSKDGTGAVRASDLDPSRFAEVRPSFVASLRVVRIHREALHLFRMVDQGEPLQDHVETLYASAPSPMSVPVAVWRRRYTVHHQSLSSQEAESLTLAAGGATLGELCETYSHHPDPVSAAFAVLLPWFERQWIAALD